MAYCCQAAIANPEYVPGLEQFPRSNPASWNYPDGCLNRPAFRRSKLRLYGVPPGIPQSRNGLSPSAGAGRKYLRVSRRCARRSGGLLFHGGGLLSRYKKDRGSPCGNQIESGNQFRGEGGQEGPVPAEKTDHDSAGNNVHDPVRGREQTLEKDGGAADLNGILSNRDQPCDPVTRRPGF